MSSRQDMYIPEDLQGVLGGYEFDPEFAHVTVEMLRQLDSFHFVGIPKDWMQKIMGERSEITLNELPADFKERQLLLNVSFEDIYSNLRKMTILANAGSHEIMEHRQRYQQAENKIMDIVVSSMEGFLQDPKSTMLIMALRGAKFFEKMMKKYADHSMEVEAKRIPLKPHNEGDPLPFVVGLGPINEATEMEVEGIKTLLLPDDCLSTGMTQFVLLENTLEKGYRPDNIVMVFTVGTATGIKYLYDKFEELKARFDLETQLNIQCGAICYKVDEDMYLQTLKKEKLVGDMGNWNKSLTLEQ